MEIITTKDGPLTNKPQRDNIVIISPKWTKCELSFHFILDFNTSNADILILICRDFPLKQRDIFDILIDWERGVNFKVKKCASI